MTTESLVNHYQATDILFKSKRSSFYNPIENVITTHHLGDKITRDYQLPFNNVKLYAYPNSHYWVGYDLDSNKIFTFDALSNKLRTINIKQKHTVKLESNKIVLHNTEGKTKVFNSLEGLHAHMSHHAMQKSQAILVQKRKVIDEEKKEEEKEDKHAREPRESRSYKEYDHLTPCPALINNFIKVIVAKIDAAELQQSLKDFRFNKDLYTSLEKIAKANYRKALLINANSIQQINLEEKYSQPNEVVEQFQYLMSGFAMLYWNENYISTCDKKNKIISVYNIKDKLIREYKFPFENARIMPYPNSHFWIGYELDSKSMFTYDASTNTLRKIVLETKLAIKLDPAKKIIIFAKDKHGFKKITVLELNTLDELHAYMSRHAETVSQLQLAQERQLTLDQDTKEEAPIHPSKSNYIKPPIGLFKTLINTLLEAKMDEKELKQTMKSSNFHRDYYLDHWNKEANNRYEKALVSSNLLSNEKPDTKNRHQNNIRNAIIKMMQYYLYEKNKSANFIRMLMILLKTPKQIKLDLHKLIEAGLIENQLLNLTTISKKNSKEIQQFIQRLYDDVQVIVFRQLLISAKIISEEQANDDNEILLNWIIVVCMKGVLSNNVIKLDMLRVILQTTNKHEAIETVDFTPFVLCGILDKQEVKKLLAHAAHHKPIVQNVLSALGKRNQDLFQLFQPLLEAGYATSDEFTLIGILCLSIDSYDDDKMVQTSEKERINLRILPILNVMQRNAEIFETTYGVLKNHISEEDLKEARSNEVTTVNTFWSSDTTPLTDAASHGYFEIVQLLIKHGAKLNLTKKDPDYGKRGIEATALVSATHGGNLQIVKLLVEGGVDVNQIERLGATSLCNAASGGHIDIVKYLLEQKGILLVQEHQAHNNYEWTAINRAMITARIDILNLLLVATLEKINQGIVLFPGLPMWLIMDIFAGLQDLQNVSYPDAGPFAINLDFHLSPYKNILINKIIGTILTTAKTLPQNIEEKDKPSIKQQYKTIIQEQKEVLLKYMGEPQKIKDEVHKKMDLKSIEPQSVRTSEVKYFLHLYISLRRSLLRVVSDDHEFSGIGNQNSFLVLKTVVEILMQHEPTKYMLREVLTDLFKSATQKNQIVMTTYLLETAKLLNMETAFYLQAIDSATFFCRPELLSELLNTTKEIDSKTILNQVFTGFNSMMSHIRKAVDYQNYLNQTNRKKESSPVKLHQQHLKQIGLIFTEENIDPQTATKALLNNLGEVLKILFNSVVDVYSIPNEYAMLVAQFFPELLPSDHKFVPNEQARTSTCGIYGARQQQDLERTLKSSIKKLIDENDNAYEILGLQPDAKADDIKSSYRKKATEAHPDLVAADKREEATNAMSRINRAYEVLGHAQAREHYDKELSAKLSVSKKHS